MLNVISCPACGRQLQLPDEALSRHVQCPGCRASFPARRPSPSLPDNAPILRLIVEDEVNGPPIQGLPPPPRPLAPVLLEASVAANADRTDAGLARCPACTARYTTHDQRCPACGTLLPEQRAGPPWDGDHAPLRRDCEPHRGPLLLTLGRCSIGLSVPGMLGVAFLPFLLAALLAVGGGLATHLLAAQDLELMRRREMDPDGERSTITGQSCGSVGLVLGLIGVALVIFFRLPLLLADLR
ncbi:MAG: hypothetical protein JNM56_22265 [Planctomycetia bacterium]|nr:hypothetical protein [Planctomycetia bacterium]